MERLIITVDGPAGTGKSTVSKMFADRIGYTYLDTGALYRAVAYRTKMEGISAEDNALLFVFCKDLEITVVLEDGLMRIRINGDDITDKVRTEEIGMLASKISAVPFVREMLLPVQREAAGNGGVIAEGRDMGTVVFPDADIKFFLNAQGTERAKRRYQQLYDRGERPDFNEIRRDLEIRDRQDTGRNVAPLRPSENAVIIDTTEMNVGSVVDTMIAVTDCHQKKVQPD